MPRLDQRLRFVARQIRCRTHADIGSDHGHLLKALLTSGRIERGIAIENKVQPFENSKRTLAGLPADVRFFDGLQGLAAGEADGVSLCGMGGKTIARLLSTHPERLPPVVIAQPNDHVQSVREWAWQSSFHLMDETIALGSRRSGVPRRFIILRFERATSTNPDPAYAGLDVPTALHFGPHFIRNRNDEFLAALEDERRYLYAFAPLGDRLAERLATIETLLSRTSH